MGSPGSVSFITRFLELAGPGRSLSFERFMDLALYDEGHGYYRAKRQRVGVSPGTDFRTAASSGPLFGELVLASCETLLKEAGLAPADHDFVEIGAETEGGVLAGLRHPFRSSRCIRLGDSLRLSGACVVFSNELFDAQPCRRFLRRDGAWVELGVGVAEGALVEQVLPGQVNEAWLPREAPEGSHFDAPRAAVSLLDTLSAQPWSGLFVAFDYGMNSESLVDSCPQGTVRAYRHHAQVTELLAQPGEQDLTCHVCWDWLASVLERHGFSSPLLESQEAFFVRHAASFLSSLVSAEAGSLSPRKLSLLELLHPSNMGQRFQCLHGLRHPSRTPPLQGSQPVAQCTPCTDV